MKMKILGSGDLYGICQVCHDLTWCDVNPLKPFPPGTGICAKCKKAAKAEKKAETNAK